MNKWMITIFIGTNVTGSGIRDIFENFFNIELLAPRGGVSPLQ